LKAAGIYESFARTIDLLGRVKKKPEKTTWFVHFIGLPGFLIILGIIIYFLLESVSDTK
jgi:hypothetical protein